MKETKQIMVEKPKEYFLYYHGDFSEWLKILPTTFNYTPENIIVEDLGKGKYKITLSEYRASKKENLEGLLETLEPNLIKP